MNIGSLIAYLGMDIGDFKKGSKVVKSEIQGIEKDWKKLGIISSHQFKKMKDDFIQAHNRIKKHASSTDKDILASKRALVNKLNKLNKQYANQTKRTLSKVNKDWTSALKGIGSAVTLYLSADAIYDWTRSIIDAGIRIQSVENAFKAITGTTKLARRELAFVGKTADDLGLKLNVLEESYKGLAAASINTKLEGKGARDVFYAVAEATSAMQLSTTQSHAALYALQQMMSKGRVQTEELRRQLGEQLPGAFQIAAEAMEVTTAQLNYMLERGQVVSEDFLPKFAKVLHERFGKAAVENAELARGAFNRFSNSVERLKRTLAGTGLLEFFADVAKIGTQKIRRLEKEIRSNSESITKYMDNIAGSFEIALKGIDVKSVMNDLSFVARTLRGIGATIGSIVDIYKSVPEFAKTGVIVGVIGAISPTAGVVVGLAAIAKSLMDFKRGIEALKEGGITWGDFIGPDDGTFEKALDNWDKLKILTSGNIETQKELAAAVEFTEKKLIKLTGNTWWDSFWNRKEIKALNVDLKEFRRLLDIKEQNVSLQKAADVYKDIRISLAQIKAVEETIELDKFLGFENMKEQNIQLKSTIEEIYNYERGIYRADKTIEEAVKTSKDWVKELEEQEKNIKETSEAFKKAIDHIKAFEKGVAGSQVDEMISKAVEKSTKLVKILDKISTFELRVWHGDREDAANLEKAIDGYDRLRDILGKIKDEEQEYADSKRILAKVIFDEQKEAINNIRNFEIDYMKERMEAIVNLSISQKSAIKELKNYENGIVSVSVKIEEAVKYSKDWIKETKNQKRIYRDLITAQKSAIKEIDNYENGVVSLNDKIKDAIQYSKDWVKELKEQEEASRKLAENMKKAVDHIKAFEKGTAGSQVDEMIAKAVYKKPKPIPAFTDKELSKMKIDAIRDEEKVLSDQWHSDIERMNKIIAKEKEVYTWRNETSLQARIEAIQTEESVLSNQWKSDIERMNSIIAKEKEVYKKSLDIQSEFNDQYAELGKTKFDIERDLLSKEVEVHKQANVDKVKLDEWASAKSKEISKAESEQRISDIHNTVSIMTDGFKDISEMGVKHSKESFLAYQAFKIIEIGIATRSAAIGAYSAMASIPYVGPALGIAAAIAATTFGVAQAAAVASMQPPSYDSGGISSARGIYQTGNISEAHIPIPSGGKIPVEMKDKKETVPQEVNIANLFDPAMIDEYIASSRGQNAIFNTIGKRPQLLKRVISR